MNRRLTAPLASAAAAVIAMTTLASPAQAAPLPGYVKYKTFGWPDACSSAGSYYQQQGLYRFYYCDTVVPAQPASGPGVYDLWVAY
jgi:hypothetical protein